MKLDITKPELVWPGKYDDDGNLVENRGAALPFQVIETIKEGRATRQSGYAADLFSYTAQQSDEDNWHNKLIWGDNLLVLSSLLSDFAGRVDLIYIDPPFATGADFSFEAQVGEGARSIQKHQSAIEEKAYRDTWGGGLASYLAMLAPRLRIARDLLSDEGCIYVHVGWQVASSVKCLLDEVFGPAQFQNEIIWKRQTAKGGAFGGLSQYGRIHETIFFYSKGERWTWNQLYTEYEASHVASSYKYIDEDTGRRYSRRDLTAAGSRKGDSGKPIMIGEDRIGLPAGRHWAIGLNEGETVQEGVNRLVKDGRIWYEEGKMPRLKLFLDDMKGVPLQSIWTDISPVQAQSTERLGYDTQKPKSLLNRVISASSNPDDLVMDFFCGSGTTAAVAEELGRRWIACDLGRFAVHTTRKRLLEVEDCRPFEVLNLGRYERKYWQGAEFGGDGADEQAQAAYTAYIRFILDLYQAQPIQGEHVHGKKGSALVMVGAVDAPVTISHINDGLAECAAMDREELHVLGWEWEMGMNDPIVKQAKTDGVRLRLLSIPREVMEKRAVECGDIRFFDLAYLEAEVKPVGKKTNEIRVELTDFVIPDTELIPEDVRSKITKWSDYIDYWAIDWDFQHDTFMNQWQTYRTRQNRKLELVSEKHKYDGPGTYKVLIKVVDIFGNDTSRMLEWEVK